MEYEILMLLNIFSAIAIVMIIGYHYIVLNYEPKQRIEETA